MLAEKEPSLGLWRILSHEEVNEKWEESKKFYGNVFHAFFFFLTEASEDYLVWEGEVYQRKLEKEAEK